MCLVVVLNTYEEIMYVRDRNECISWNECIKCIYHKYDCWIAREKHETLNGMELLNKCHYEMFN